jgi:hypothetical protein
MKVVWSDEAVYALVALEMRLAQRYSAEKAAEVVDELVRRIDRLEDHAHLGRWCRNTALHSSANWWTTGIAYSTGCARTSSRSSQSCLDVCLSTVAIQRTIDGGSYLHEARRCARESGISTTVGAADAETRHKAA